MNFLALCVLASGADILAPDGTPDPSFPALYSWHTAEDGVNGPGAPADGATVSRWDDHSGHARHLVRVDANAAERPTFRAGIANGLPAVDFDGNDYIWGDATTEFGTITTGKTVFAVVRVDAANNGYVFDGSSDSGRNAFFTGQQADPAHWHLFAGNSPVTVGPFVGTDVFQVHSVMFDDGANEHWINGDSVASGNAAMQELRGLILGSRYSVSFFLDGAIAELLVYDSVLGDADRQAIEGYLLEKHPITEPDLPPPWVDVFASGDGLYDTYRIPAVITTNEGSVLAFAEGRATPSDHARNDIVMRRSTDGGDTWSPVAVLHDAGGDSLNDPLVLQVRTGAHAGRIYLHYMRFPEGCHTTCVVPGYVGPNVSRNYLQHSDDDGRTWSGPIEVTQEFRRETTNFAGSPGFGLQKRHAPNAGRVIFPLRQGPAGNVKMYAVYSDDGGDSWTWGDLVDDSATPGGGDEVQMIELADGSLLLNARSYSGTNHRKVAMSLDGGETWTPLADDDELIEPQVMASVAVLTDPADGFSQSRILYAGPNSQSSRVDGTVHLSYDGGNTWPVARSIYPGAYAYSVLTVIDPCDTIGSLFERDNYQFISLSRFTLDWLTDCADTLDDESPCACPGDVDGSGDVGFPDLLAVLAAWGPCPGCDEDFDKSGDVGFPDLLIILASWGSCG